MGQKKDKVGDIVTWGNSLIRINVNRSGNCRGCFFTRFSKIECLKACNLYGDCFNFSAEEPYVKFVGIKNNNKDKQTKNK